MAQPHPPATPSGPTSQQASHPTSTGVTEGLPSSATATSPQVGGYAPQSGVVLNGRRGLILAGCALLGIVIGVAGSQVKLDAGSAPAVAAPSPTTSAPVAVPISQVTGVSERGTSFKQEGSVWKTQRYTSQSFGNLKDGAGLLLDLGSARSLSAVTFTADEGPITVELRAGDSATPDGKGYQTVGAAVQATGATSLPASAGGSHRYWLIWVSKLAPTLQASISNPAAKG